MGVSVRFRVWDWYAWLEFELRFSIVIFSLFWLKWVQNRVDLLDGEPMVVFGWLLKGNLTDERRNSEGMRNGN